MKKQILVQVITLLSLALIAPVAIADLVADGPHNFSSDYAATFRGSSNEICIYCHTPHGGVVRDNTLGISVPLWNRTLNDMVDGYFTMYGGNSATFDATLTKPTGPSLLCLSCHDGVSSLSGVLNYSGAAITFTPYDQIKQLPLTNSSRNINIGQDLSNDHPVSFEYDATLVNKDKTTNNNVPGLKDPTLINKALKLYGPTRRRLECPTCHDPHDYGSTGTPSRIPFLRMSNDRSDMCRECHIK